MNKLAHAIVLCFFTLTCWFVWGFLRSSGGVPLGGRALPVYTRLCLGMGRNVLTGLVVAATLYCLWVWSRKSDGRAPWVAFLATACGVLTLVLVLVGIAAYLPLLDALNLLAQKG